MNAWKHIFFSFAICVASGFGQGAVEFENAVGFGDGIDRLVRDANGAPLVGINFLAQLYYGPENALETSLVAVAHAPAPFRVLTTQAPGKWNTRGDPFRILDGFTPYQTVTLQVRVWDSGAGATWEDAAAINFGGTQHGASELFTYRIPPYVCQPPNCYSMYNFRGFMLGPQPPTSDGNVWFENDSMTLVTNLCTGEPAFSGSNFLAALYYGPNGTTNESQLTVLGDVIPLGPQPGQFHGGIRTAPATTIPGQIAVMQVRIWESAYGSTYEQAISAPPQNGRKALAATSALLRVPTSRGGPPTSLVSNGLSSIVLGYSDCVVPGSVLLQNSLSQLVTNLCTAEPVVPGNSFLAALYYAPDGTTNESLFSRIGEPTSFGPEPGRFHGGVRLVPGVALGQFAMFQTRVWESAFGGTYEEALAAPPRNERHALAGKSTIVRVQTLAPGLPLLSPLEAGNSGRPFYIGAPDCIPPGSVLFQNSLSTLVTNGCTGQRLEIGSNFLAALYYAPLGTSNDALFVQLGPAVGIGPQPGRIQGGPRVVPSAIGHSAMFQVRVWEAGFGLTYEQAAAAGPVNGQVALTGKSVLVAVPTWATNSPVSPSSPIAVNGFQGFNVSFPLTSIAFSNTPTTLVYNLCTGLKVEAGTKFLAKLYYAPDGVSDEALFIPLGPGAGFGPAPGQLQAGPRLLSKRLFPGEAVNLQIRVWESAFGSTYEAALVAPAYYGRKPLLGKSGIIRLKNAGECSPFRPLPSLAAAGLQYFYVGGQTCEETRAVFSASSLHLPAFPNGIFAAGAGDVNGDGRDDVVLLEFSGEVAHVLMSNGDGTFRVDPGGPVSVGGAGSIALTDFDGDGRADLLAAIPASNEVRVFPSLGNGSFAPGLTNSLPFRTDEIIAGDFDDDGKMDVLAVNTFGRAITLLSGDGMGHLVPSVYSSLSFQPVSIIAVRLGNDCRFHVLATCDGSDDLKVLTNAGNGHFALAANLPMQRHATKLASSDFNGDGQDDLLTVNGGENFLTVMLGNGSFEFTPIRSFAGPGLALGSGLAGDYNGDGKPDFFVTDSATYFTTEGGRDFFEVMLNNTDWPRLADDQGLTYEDTPVLIDVLANDYRPGVPLTIRSISQPSNGVVFIVEGTNVLYSPGTNFFGTDSFKYSISDCGGGDPTNTATVMVTVLPVNDPPLAVIRAFPQASFPGTDADVVLISPNNLNATVILDGSFSSDIENDPLQLFWFETGAMVPFANGVKVTNLVHVGSHAISLVVFDGALFATNQLVVEVITPCEAVRELISLLDEVNLSSAMRHHLLPPLNAGCEAFEDNEMIAGIRHLHAFRNAVRAHLSKHNPALAERMDQLAQEIIDAVMSHVSRFEHRHPKIRQARGEAP